MGKMLVTISQSQKSHLQIASLVQNPKTLHIAVMKQQIKAAQAHITPKSKQLIFFRSTNHPIN